MHRLTHQYKALRSEFVVVDSPCRWMLHATEAVKLHSRTALVSLLVSCSCIESSTHRSVWLMYCALRQQALEVYLHAAQDRIVNKVEHQTELLMQTVSCSSPKTYSCGRTRAQSVPVRTTWDNRQEDRRYRKQLIEETVHVPRMLRLTCQYYLCAVKFAS